MSPLKRVALVGGTGLLGSTIVQAIVSRKDLFELTVFIRSNSASKLPDEVRSVTIESFEDAAENESFVRSLSGHDVLVSTLNSAVALRLEPKLVAAAIKAGVKHFMPSEYTLDVTHQAALELGSATLIGARAAWADQLSQIASLGQVTYTTLVTGGLPRLGH